MGVRKFVIALSLLCSASCTDVTGPNISGIPGYMISEVRVTPEVDTIFVSNPIRVSDRIAFNASATGKNGNLLPISRFVWSTSDPAIATVDESGIVTPVSVGTVEVIASADKIGKATLVILPAILNISISPAVDTILVTLPIVASRDTIRLTATARSLSGSLLPGIVFDWESSATTVVTVESTGLVRAVGVGVATISAFANGHSASAQVHVILVVSRTN